MFLKRKTKGSVMVETVLTMPIFLLIIFSFIELSRALYVKSTMSIAAQQVANLIAINAKRSSTYDISSFSTFANRVKFPGAVEDANQFSFRVLDPSNNPTGLPGNSNLADAAISTKVEVNVIFPPPNKPSLKIPIFDPGKLIGLPIFGRGGLMISAQSVCFLEKSRRPVLN